MNKLISIPVLFVLLASCGGDLASDKYTSKPSTVIAVGGCGGGDGFFDGNRTCGISVRSISGDVSHGQTWDYVMVGQLVYKECWIVDGNHSCFVNYTHSPREMYKN